MNSCVKLETNKVYFDIKKEINYQCKKNSAYVVTEEATNDIVM